METELPPDTAPAHEPALDAVQPPLSAPPASESVALSDIPLSSSPEYRDRSTGLAIFGALQIILGLMAALMIPFAALGVFMSRLAPGGARMRPGQFLASVAIYAIASALLICLGIGSLQAKRWARALTLVFSSYWLFSGSLILVMFTAVLPVMTRTIMQAQRNAGSGTSPELSAGIMAVVLTVVIVFAALFLVVIPIAFVVFYGRSDVADTCCHRDPIERWTDRTPLPVLGAGMIFVIGAAYMVATALGAPTFPFFGRYVYGIPATACFLIFAALDAYLAVAFYRLNASAWWIAVSVLPVRLISMALTFARADMAQAYSKMGMSDQQMQMAGSNPMFRVLLWWSLLSSVIVYGYILWLKRYFKTPANQPMDPVAVQFS